MVQWILIPSTILITLLGSPTGQTVGGEQSPSQTQTSHQTQPEGENQVTPKTQVLKQWLKDYTVRTFKSEQDYQMCVFPGFEASGEEPGRDVVIDTLNPENFMRIQKLPEAFSMASEQRNIVTELKTIGTPQQWNAKTVFHDPFFQQVTYIYTVQGQGVTKTVLLLRITGSYFRITISTVPAGQISGVGLACPFEEMMPEHLWAVGQVPYLRMIRTISTSKANAPETPSIIAGTVEPKLIDMGSTAEGVHQYIFMVKNQTEVPQTLVFPTTQTYDYVLKKNGATLEQYSVGKVFGQVVTARTLRQGEELFYLFHFSNLGPGHYTLEAWLETTNPLATKHVSSEFDI
ncbi:BsuPI-related putative proteinase inhibitor [Alicyclobacillus mengziensis]|uniref:Intracellular proteinase inhibitor BsuPI domain-containing protein n=1 Tax=Alicyclobacillus mengziensis TaxID=2931921 RepID=A0A9X7VWV2_9BACL|nr:BsuPI-related putative proteinase inhibitor [Alicyclobacillus mengziensis]QSO46327.1 hypothetical protein JZ786_17765 [Alicyclobacillus mengziensis]